MKNTITQSFIKRKQQPEDVIQHIKSFPMVLASNETSARRIYDKEIQLRLQFIFWFRGSEEAAKEDEEAKKEGELHTSVAEDGFWDCRLA